MNDHFGLLRALTGAGVQFTVVGGTAAVLHGASTATYDLDVLMSFSLQNCERLVAALARLDPRLSHTPDKRRLTQSPAELTSFKNLDLLTSIGRLDVLGSLPPIESPEEVHRRAVQVELEGLTVRVVSLDDLIRVKAAMRRPKDKLVETELRAVKAARAARGD